MGTIEVEGTFNSILEQAIVNIFRHWGAGINHYRYQSLAPCRFFINLLPEQKNYKYLSFKIFI